MFSPEMNLDHKTSIFVTSAFNIFSEIVYTITKIRSHYLTNVTNHLVLKLVKFTFFNIFIAN